MYHLALQGVHAGCNSGAGNDKDDDGCGGIDVVVVVVDVVVVDDDGVALW